MPDRPTSERQEPLLPGTLDMLVLKAIALEPMHGYGIGLRLAQVSRGVFQVNPGSLFPAFRRLERAGWIRGEWRATENNRRAKYYVATPRGLRRLDTETRAWARVTSAITRILEA